MLPAASIDTLKSNSVAGRPPAPIDMNNDAEWLREQIDLLQQVIFLCERLNGLEAPTQKHPRMDSLDLTNPDITVVKKAQSL